MKHKKTLLLCLLCVLTVLSGGNLSAQILIGETTYSSIKLALESISEGGDNTITIGSDLIITEEILIEKSVIIKGLNDDNPITIRTEGSTSKNRLFNIKVGDGASVTFENLLLTGGDISEEEEDGGLILLSNTTYDDDSKEWPTLHLNNMTFNSTHAANGGAIGTDKNGRWNIKMNETEFSGNTSRETGGAIALFSSNLVAQNSKFISNVTGSLDEQTVDEYFGMGGAIYAANEDEEVSFNFEYVTFEGNTAYNMGGGLYLNNVPLSVRGNSEFKNNIAGFVNDQDPDEILQAGSGGAICLEAQTQEINLTLDNADFTSNEAIGYSGGAVFTLGKIISSISGCDFTSNKAGSSGGAIAFQNDYEGCTQKRDIILLEENEFTGNTAGNEITMEGGGGAMFFDVIYGGYKDEEYQEHQEQYIVFRNNIFTSNKAFYNGGAIVGSVHQVSLSIEGESTKFKSNEAGMYGGAIMLSYYGEYCENSDCGGFDNRLLIEEVIFEDNKIIPVLTDEESIEPEIYKYKGGALYLESNSADIIKTTFTSNGIESGKNLIAGYGGAFFLNGCGEGKGINIQESTFKDNYILLTGKNTLGGGGAISNECGGGTINLTGTSKEYMEFTGNSVQIDDLCVVDEPMLDIAGGGAIALLGGALKVKYALFSNNSFTAEGKTKDYSYLGGGAVLLKSDDDSNSLFEKTTFVENKVEITANMLSISGGGAIYSLCGAANLAESTLAFNTLDLSGVTGYYEMLGGGAVYYSCAKKATIANSTITRNHYILPTSVGFSSGGAGCMISEDINTHILSSIIIGNYINDDKDVIEDIYQVSGGSLFPVKMANSIYQQLAGFNLHSEKLGNKASDIGDIFGGEPTLNDYTIRISESGIAATAGTLVGVVKTPLNYDFYYVKGKNWYTFECEPANESDPISKKGVDFVRNNPNGNFGLKALNGAYDEENPYDPECPDCGPEYYDGRVLRIAQNEVDRLAYGHNRGVYNAGAYALLPSVTPPVPTPEAHLQWSEATSEARAFADIADGTTTTVKEPTPVYLQIRPVVKAEDLIYDSWNIEYSVVPVECFYPFAQNVPADSRYDLNNGAAHTAVGTYTYTATALNLYHRGSLVESFSFRESPYMHTIVINKDDTPIEPPVDPWPPVLPPDPEDPDPNPDSWIIFKQIAPFCYTDGYIVLPFVLNYQDKPLEYAVAFTEASKAAGFKDIETFKDLPKDGVITIPVNNYINPGYYTGYIVLREKGTQGSNLYPFKVQVVEYVKITEPPVSHSNFCNGDLFTLTVKASGDVLSYQWYYKNEKIIGANRDTYSNTVSKETIGDYFVAVTGHCNADTSHVTVGMNEFQPLPKWDDVLYIDNTDNRFVKFQWYKDGNPVGTYGSSVYYTENAGFHGTYHVRAYLNENEYIESCPIHYPVHTRSSSVNIYPNPVNREEYITVESDEKGESYIGALIELYDLNGRKAYATTATAPRVLIPVTVPAGVYVLHIKHTSGKITTQKVIVK